MAFNLAWLHFIIQITTQHRHFDLTNREQFLIEQFYLCLNNVSQRFITFFQSSSSSFGINSYITETITQKRQTLEHLHTAHQHQFEGFKLMRILDAIAPFKPQNRDRFNSAISKLKSPKLYILNESTISSFFYA